MFRKICTITALSLLTAGALRAQGNAIRLQLEPGSQLTFDGTSTLHGFTCKTTNIQAYIDVDPSYATKDLSTIAKPIANVKIVIPVKSLQCGGELEKNMFKTLKADQFPTITYTLGTYEVAPGSASASSFVAQTNGTLNIAGKDNTIAMRVDAARVADGVVTATGQHVMKMSDYGIKPPTFMLGTLRVGNQITVKYTLKATAKNVAAAIAARTGELLAAQ